MGQQGLRHAEGGKGEADDNGAGQQDVEGDTDEVGPEVADGLAAVGRERPRQGRGDRDAGGGGGEVLHRQSGHLREVTGRALAGVELPVSVGHEADGGVECQVRRHAGEALGVQRQQVLQAQDRIEEEEGGRREGQEREGVGQPALALLRIDPRQAVEDRLHRLQHRAEPCGFVLPNPRHVDAKGPAEADGEADRQGDLGPSLDIHGSCPLRSLRGAAAPPACRR